MPSVDDLVISLTIKETSDLGKLKKSLDSLTGSRGGGLKGVMPSFMYLKRDLIGLKQDSTWIKNRMLFLLPPSVPKSGVALQETARISHTLIDKDRQDMISKMITKDENALKKFMTAHGLSSAEEVREFMDERLTEYQFRLEDVIGGIWTGDKAQRFVARVDTLISRKDLEIGEAFVLVKKIEDSIAEFNAEVAKMLRELGLFSLPEFNMIKFSLRQLNEFSTSSNQFRRDITEFEKFLKIDPTDQLYKNIAALGRTGKFKDPLDFLEQAFKMAGITKADVKAGMFTKSNILNDPKLKIMLGPLMEAMSRIRGTAESMGIPIGWGKAIVSILKKEIMSTGLPKETKEKWVEMMKLERVTPDLMIVAEDLQKLTTGFGPEVAKKIVESFFTFGEYKKILSKSNQDQFEKYKSYVGDRLFGLGAMVENSFRQYLPGIPTGTVNVMTQIAKLQGRELLTKDELDDLGSELSKNFTSEILLTGVKQAIENVKTLIPEEMYKKLTSSNEWNNIFTDISNKEMLDDIIEEMNELKDVEEKNLVMELLKALKLFVSAVKSGIDVEKVGES